MTKQKTDISTILSQIDYKGIIYCQDSHAVVKVNEEDGDYKIKDFITPGDVINTNVSMVEIKDGCLQTYNENDVVYYFMDTTLCDLMPHSIFSGSQPKILNIEPGSVLFIKKKSDHLIIGSLKAIMITLPNNSLKS